MSLLSGGLLMSLFREFVGEFVEREGEFVDEFVEGEFADEFVERVC